VTTLPVVGDSDEAGAKRSKERQATTEAVLSGEYTMSKMLWTI
jgi:hypothetical protein